MVNGDDVVKNINSTDTNKYTHVKAKGTFLNNIR